MGGKPSLPGAACSALGGSGGAPRVVLLGRGSSFPLPPRKARDTHDEGVTPDERPRELAGAVGEVATPCTDGRPSENTPPWLGLHQSSLPNAAKEYPPREIDR